MLPLMALAARDMAARQMVECHAFRRHRLNTRRLGNLTVTPEPDPRGVAGAQPCTLQDLSC